MSEQPDKGHKCIPDGYNEKVQVKIPARTLSKGNIGKDVWLVTQEDPNLDRNEQMAYKVAMKTDEEPTKDDRKKVVEIQEGLVVFPERSVPGVIFQSMIPTKWETKDYAVATAFTGFFILGFLGIIGLTFGILTNKANMRYGYVEGELECADDSYAAQLQGKTLEELNALEAPTTPDESECLRQAKEQQVQGIKDRESARAKAASFILSIVFSSLNSALDATCKINPATSTALVGMMMNGTVGFLLDNALGQDDGFKIWQEQGVGPAMRYAFAQLDVTTSPKFVRYIVTILFDVFISVILFKPLYGSLIRAPFFRCGETPRAMANGLVSAFIAIVTFQVYANNMRLNWAYPSKMIMNAEKESPGTIINGTTMLIATVIMAMVYLNTETRVNPAATGEGINDPVLKRYVVFFVFILMGFLSSNNNLNPSMEEAQGPGTTTDLSSRSSAGFGIFVGIVFIAIFGTLSTSKALSTFFKKLSVGALIIVIIVGSFFMLQEWSPKAAYGQNSNDYKEKATLAHQRKNAAIMLLASAFVLAVPVISNALRSASQYIRMYWNALFGAEASSTKIKMTGGNTLWESFQNFLVFLWNRYIHSGRAFFVCTGIWLAVLAAYGLMKNDTEKQKQNKTNMAYAALAMTIVFSVTYYVWK